MGPERITLSIPSNPRYLYVVRAWCQSLLECLTFSEEETRRVVLAVHEACANVMKHCYGGDLSQRIDLAVLIAPQEVIIEIRDYGSVTPPVAIKPRDLNDVRPGGLGTYFMQLAMDDITYNAAAGGGTVLRMRKRRRQACTSA